MANNEKLTQFAILGIVAILGIMLYQANSGQFGAVGGTVTQGGEACAGLSTQPIAYATAYFVDPTSNNLKTQVATTMTFAKPETSIIYTATTGSTTNYSSTTVPCGTSLAILAGDGGATTYYYNGMLVPVVDKVSVFADLEVVKSGAASIRMRGDANPSWNTTIDISNASLTDPDTTMQVQVRVPTTAGAYFGDQGWAMCLQWNSGNITKAYPTPYTAAVSIPHVLVTGTRNTIACYEMPGMLKSTGSDYIGTIYIDRAATVPTVASTIGITLVDKTAMLFNGKMVVGYDTSVTNGLNTDAGRADVTTAGAISITV